MKAGRIHRFGAAEVITLEDVPIPRPGNDEVLVRVKAAGVGPWDARVRAGRSALPQSLPLTLGSDISGIVEMSGAGVEGIQPGDSVFGVTNRSFTGAYAEYALASVNMLAPKPLRLTHVEAASVPVVAVTAFQMLFDHAGAAPGQRVLVQGAAGNVGAYAVQLARSEGAQVIATASARDTEFVRSLGAQTVEDSCQAGFGDAFDAVDVAIDTVGGEAQSLLFPVLRREGILVSCVSPPDRARLRLHGLRGVFFLVDVTTRHLSGIARMIDRGELAVHVGAVLPLAEVRAAHEMLDGLRPRPRGKIVLQVEH